MRFQFPLLSEERDFRILILGSAFFSFGFFMYQVLFTNFAADEINILPSELGLLESIREIPGLLSIFIAAATMYLLEPRLAGIALLLMAAGVANYFHLNDVTGLIIFSFIWSIGFHSWAPISLSLALRLGRKGYEGRRLGLLRSSGNVAGLLGIAIVYFLVTSTGLRPLFVVSAIFIGLGGLVILRIRMPASQASKQQRFVLRRRYRLFYVLQILSGTRRHVFMTFALFALIRVHGTSIETIAALSFVNQIGSIISAYYFGRWIDRYGEKPILAWGFAGLTFVFLGYAFVTVPWILYVLYVVDNILFNNSIAITTYVEKILISPADLRPTMVTGQTMNHVAAVIVPVAGGLLWQAYGHVLPFVAGAIIAAISVFASLLITTGRVGPDAIGTPEPLAASAD
jgi:MFS family permease